MRTCVTNSLHAHGRDARLLSRVVARMDVVDDFHGATRQFLCWALGLAARPLHNQCVFRVTYANDSLYGCLVAGRIPIFVRCIFCFWCLIVEQYSGTCVLCSALTMMYGGQLAILLATPFSAVP